MDAGGQLPPPLKQLAPVLKHAAQLRSQVPVMSYLCTLYAIQLGLKLKGNDHASKTFLVGLMDRLEQQRKELGASLPADQKAFATNFAVKVFGLADDEYRAGVANRDTAKNFYAATVFLEVLKQFDDPLPEELENMRKYAKYSAVQITKAIKLGLPVVHPESEQQDTQTDSSFAGGNEGGGDFDPFSAAAGFPPTPSSFSVPTGPTVDNGSTGAASFAGSAAPFSGSPSVTQPTPFHGHAAGGFDIPSTTPSSIGQPSRRDLASPPTSSTWSSSSPAGTGPFGPGSPQGGHPSAFPPPAMPSLDFGFPPPAAQPPQGSHMGAAQESLEQLLSLFPMVPSSASAAAPAAGGPPALSFGHPGGVAASGSSNGGSGGGSPNVPNMNWAPTTPPAVPTIPSGFAASTPAISPAQAPAPAASAPAAATASADGGGSSVALTSSELSAAALDKAQKYARFAVSALQFEDIPYAVQNLQLALALLTRK